MLSRSVCYFKRPDAFFEVFNHAQNTRSVCLEIPTLVRISNTGPTGGKSSALQDLCVSGDGFWINDQEHLAMEIERASSDCYDVARSRSLLQGKRDCYIYGSVPRLVP